MLNYEYTKKDHLMGILSIFIYTGLAQISFILAFESTSVSPLWLPSGWILAFMLYNSKYLPYVFISSFISDIINLSINDDLSTHNIIITALGIGFGNTIETYLSVYLYKKYCDNAFSILNSIPILTKFIVLICILSTTLNALIGYCTLRVTDQITNDKWGILFITWWIGDCMGKILLFPICKEIIYFVRTNSPNANILFEKIFNPKNGYFLVNIGVIGIMTLLISGNLIVKTHELPLEYLLVPLPIFITLQYENTNYTYLILIIISLVLVYNNINHIGSFSTIDEMNDNINLLLLETLIIDLIIVTFTIKTQQILKNRRLTHKTR